MKKNILGLSIITALSAYSFADYVIVVDEKNNDYSIGGFNDIKTQGEWVEKSRSCTYDILEEEVYSGKSFSQVETCSVLYTTTETTERTYDNGTTTTESKTINKTEEEINNLTSTGVYIADSCKDALIFDSTLTDGIYDIALNDDSNKEMYCDMTNGGWTLVSHIYDRDNRDDILNNSNGAGWGDTANTPESDTAFNLENSLTPSHTDSKWQWIYPMYGDQYEHSTNNTVLTSTRFNWYSPDWSAYYLNWHLVDDLSIDYSDGGIYGVFGVHTGERIHSEYLGLLNQTHNCAGVTNTVDKAMHYWGCGNLIAFGNDSTYELHNLATGYNRADGTTNSGCGTRNAILNIWVK